MAALAQGRRQVSADSNVVALDAWAGLSIQFSWECTMAMSRGEWMCRIWKGSAIACSFDGATPDEARAKAAAWVREQKP